MLSPNDGNGVSLFIDAENPAIRHPAEAAVRNKQKKSQSVIRETIVPVILAEIGQTEGI